MDLALDKPIELTGYWFLPGQPDTKKAGTLRYLPGESLELQLIGRFDVDVYRELEGGGRAYNGEIKPTPVIFGNSMGHYITLSGCKLSRQRTTLMDESNTESEQLFSAQLLIMGAQIEGPDDLELENLEVQFGGLGALCSINCIDVSVKPGSSGWGAIQVNASTPDELTAECKIDSVVTTHCVAARVTMEDTRRKPVYPQVTIGTSEWATVSAESRIPIENLKARIDYTIDLYKLSTGCVPNLRHITSTFTTGEQEYLRKLQFVHGVEKADDKLTQQAAKFLFKLDQESFGPTILEWATMPPPLKKSSLMARRFLHKQSLSPDDTLRKLCSGLESYESIIPEDSTRPSIDIEGLRNKIIQEFPKKEQEYLLSRIHSRRSLKNILDDLHRTYGELLSSNIEPPSSNWSRQVSDIRNKKSHSLTQASAGKDSSRLCRFLSALIIGHALHRLSFRKDEIAEGVSRVL